MGAGLEHFEQPRRHARFQPVCGKSARRNSQETVDGAHKKPAIHGRMLAFAAEDRN